MEKHSYNDDDIERYLFGAMDAQEKESFEKVLKEDDALAAELDLHQDTVEGIRLDGSQSLKAQLQAVEAGLATQRDTPPAAKERRLGRRPLMTWLAIAASLVLVILLGYLALPGPGPEAIYLAYYQPYPNLINPAQRSTEIQEETVLDQALRAYDNQQYPQALALFERAGVPDDPGYTFYRGASYLGNGQPKQAIPLLEQVAQQPESLFYRPALWYSALAYLNVENSEAARPYLKQLAGAEGDYAREAREILDELE